MSQFRPMKGEKITDEQLHLLKFPVYVSWKLDGIRCLIKEGKALTASLKPIPNRFTRDFLESHPELEGFDGELVLRNTMDFTLVSSAFMSKDGEPDFIFAMFDRHDRGEEPFESRREVLAEWESSCTLGCFGQVRILQHVKCDTLQQVLAFEEEALNHGYEGIMIRQAYLSYKFGKASVNQGHLLKRKPMDESECIIYGFEEGEENTNEATLNERGLTKRSSCKEGKIPNGSLGKFLVRNKRFGEFKIGTGLGLTHSLRCEIWENQKVYVGQIVRFKFQEMGTLDKPRLPIFLNFRNTSDMDAELVDELRSLR